jgi:hypothetical protein
MNAAALHRDGAMRAPADSAVVEQVRKFLGGLPDQLDRWYRFSDGFLLASGIGVYSVTDLVERNDTFEVHDYCPGFLLIGDDSGGRGILLRSDSATESVYSSDLGDLSVDGFQREAASMDEWIAGL